MKSLARIGVALVVSFVSAACGSSNEAPAAAHEAAGIHCGGDTCTGGLICCRAVSDGVLRCATPNTSLTGSGQRCPSPSLETSIECDSQDDCAPGKSCCGV